MYIILCFTYDSQGGHDQRQQAPSGGRLADGDGPTDATMPTAALAFAADVVTVRDIINYFLPTKNY